MSAAFAPGGMARSRVWDFQSDGSTHVLIGEVWVRFTGILVRTIMSQRPPKKIKQAIWRIAEGTATPEDFDKAQQWIAQRYMELYGTPQEPDEQD
jgi:hypothetical protein